MDGCKYALFPDIFSKTRISAGKGGVISGTLPKGFPVCGTRFLHILPMR